MDRQSAYTAVVGGDVYEAVLKKATRLCARRFGINHTTLQITAAATSGGGLAACGECAAVQHAN